MKTSIYLYGEDLEFLKDMGYVEALEAKIHLAEELVRVLLKVDMFHRDGIRINDCLKAQSHNRSLIDEVNGKSSHKRIE